MDVTTRNRAELKSYFVKNSIPTESNFAELINAMLNQKDDGVVKLPDNPLSIEAAGDDASLKSVVNLYGNFSDTNPDWTFNLNPRSQVNQASTAQAGFSVTDGEGVNRLFIDRNTGRIGIGTITPGSELHVEGSGPQLAEFRQQSSAGADAVIKIRGARSGMTSADIASISLANFDENEGEGGTDYDMARISGGMQDVAGQTGHLKFYTNSGASNGGVTLKMIIDKDGQVGLGIGSPTAKLDINEGSLKLRSDGYGILFAGDARIYKKVGSGLKIKAHNDGHGIEFLGADDATSHMLIKNSKVGINTTDPQEKLHVNGNIRFGGNDWQLDAGSWQDANIMYRGSASTASFGLHGQGSKNLKVIIDGQVGINNTVPIAALDVQQARSGSSHPTVVKGLYVTGGFGADSDGVEFRHTNGSQGIGFGYNTIYATGANANQDLGLKPRGTGQVTVSGILQADKYVVQNGVDGGSSKGLQMWKATDSNWAIYMGQSGAGKSFADGTAVAGAGFSSHAIRIRTHKNSGQGLIYENSNEELNLSVRSHDGLTYIRGNLGVGTTSPAAKLDVNGEIRGKIWYSDEYTWNQGQGSVKMGHSSKCVAFLTYVRGKFEGGGEIVRVWVHSDGYWYLGGSSGQSSIRAKARCIGMP